MKKTIKLVKSEKKITNIAELDKTYWKTIEILSVDFVNGKYIHKVLYERKLDKDYYEQLIEKGIRAKYSINQELAILRQRDLKPDEFKEYNNFVESIKSENKLHTKG